MVQQFVFSLYGAGAVDSCFFAQNDLIFLQGNGIIKINCNTSIGHCGIGRSNSSLPQ